MSNFKTVREFFDTQGLGLDSHHLMHQKFSARAHNQVEIAGRSLTSFVNCYYLALDRDPRVIKAAIAGIERIGVNYCCARTRLSIAPLVELEGELAEWMGAPVVTFPTVSMT